MPGNGLGDGVHNFFVRDNPFQGQQQSQVVEGNWPTPNSSFPGGAGNGEYPFFLTHGLPLIQSSPRPGSANGSDEQPIINGFLYGNQSLQSRQNAANSDQRHFTSSRDFSFHELQQRGPDHIANASVSSEESASPASFDLFGGQHQTGHQQSNIPHFLQPRQSGINDMPQLLQQHLMIRKLQEQELQRLQLASRQDYSSQAPPSVAKQSSGNQSTLINATSKSNDFQNPLSAEYDANWLHQGPPSMQDSSNGLAFQLNTGQSPRTVNLIPQQSDQSLYGFPVSNSRGLPETQHPPMIADRYLMPQPQLTIAGSSSLHGNQNNSLADRVDLPDESFILRHGFHSQNITDVASRQSVNTGMNSRVVHQRVNSLSRNVTHETFRGKQQLNFHSETPCAKSTGQVSSPKNESALDPEEEKILFGSDDNIWAAFGNVPHISGEPGKMIGNGGSFDGLPSIQSGSWSALMQSAVAETSSNDAILQERNSLMFHNNDDGHPSRQISSMHNDSAEKVKSSSENNMRRRAALNSGSFTADNVETANTMVFNRSGSAIQQEPGHGVHIEVDQTKDHAGTVQIRLPKDNAPSQPPYSENSYNIHRLQSQSSVSQGFGLYLGPPSQRMQISQDSKDRPSVPFSTVDGSATLENGGSENFLHKMPGNTPSEAISDIPSSKTHLHDTKSTKPGIQKSINQFNEAFRGNSSHNTLRGSIETRLPDVSTSDRQDNLAASNIHEQIGKSDFREEIPSSTVPMKDYKGTSLHFSMPGNPQQRDSAKMLFNIWSNVPVHHSSGQNQLVPSQNSDSQYHNVLESSSSPMRRLEECKSNESFGQQSEPVSSDCVPKIEESIGKESTMKNHLHNSSSNSTSVLKEIEDFGRYLRPNSLSDQMYSLPKQTRALKDKDGDSQMADRPDNLDDITPAFGNAGNQGSSTAVISADSKLTSSSEPICIVPRVIPQRASIISHKGLGLNPSVSQSRTYGDSATSPRIEHHQVNPQMAPTWLSANETSKGGQTLQICDGRESSLIRTGEPPHPLGKPTIGSNALNSEEKGTDATLDESVANHHYSSSLPQVNVTCQNLVPLQQKKRKSATLEPQPWHKEISDDSRFLGILSMAEPDLSKSANRVDGVAETTEDANSVLRSKQRLIMSSQLMQQLIRAPPPLVPLSIDATASYDIVAYSVSRIALGDACHAVSYANNRKRPWSSKLLSEKRKLPTKANAQGYENAAQELIGKVTKLENDLSSLEKSASLLHLRLECQELEKLSTINRFARFHGRGQNGSSDATSATATARPLKFPAQRYVIPFAMPRHLPEAVNCLQL